MTLQQILDDINSKAYVKAAPKTVSDIPVSLIAFKDRTGKPIRMNGVQKYQIKVFTSFDKPYDEAKVEVTEYSQGGEAEIKGGTLDEQLANVINPVTPSPSWQQELEGLYSVMKQQDPLIIGAKQLDIDDKGKWARVAIRFRDPNWDGTGNHPAPIIGHYEIGKDAQGNIWYAPESDSERAKLVNAGILTA